MSNWTHVTATLSVDTYLNGTNKKVLKKVRKYLAKAPLITGSERNATVKYFIQDGHNWSSSDDCGNDIEGQSCITITIQGNLRDKLAEETHVELLDYLHYIFKKFYIRDGSFGIEGEKTIIGFIADEKTESRVIDNLE